MEKTMATLHYSATRQREIAAIRDKYAVFQGKRQGKRANPERR